MQRHEHAATGLFAICHSLPVFTTIPSEGSGLFVHEKRVENDNVGGFNLLASTNRRSSHAFFCVPLVELHLVFTRPDLLKLSNTEG